MTDEITKTTFNRVMRVRKDDCQLRNKLDHDNVTTKLERAEETTSNNDEDDWNEGTYEKINYSNDLENINNTNTCMTKLRHSMSKNRDRAVASLRSSFNVMKSILRKPGSVSASEERCSSVSFTEVHVHELEMTLGDNPSCSHGPPVCLKHSSKNSRHDPLRMQFEDFEEKRKTERRRSTEELKLTWEQRHQIVQESGVTRRDINNIMLENFLIQQELKKSQQWYRIRKKVVRNMNFLKRITKRLSKAAKGRGTRKKSRRVDIVKI